MTRKPSSKMGEALRAIRKRHGLTLTEVADQTGISRSTLYKVENAGVSLTYDKILQLAEGLEIDVAEVFGKAPETQLPTRAPTRRSYGTMIQGQDVDSPQMKYTYVCTDLLRKQITPMFVRIKARDIKDYGDLVRHGGEEFDFIVEGEVDLHTEHYETIRLKPGDFVYLDSMMGHAFVSVGDKDAVVLSVCSTHVAKLLEDQDDA